MKLILQLLSLFLSFHAFHSHLESYGPSLPIGGTPPQKGSVWPMPLTHPNNTAVYSIDSTNFQVLLNSNCELLEFARNHYQDLVRNLSSRDGVVSTVRVDILASCEGSSLYAEIPQDESYVIKVEKSGHGVEVILAAPRPLGAIRGLETIYQMMWTDPEDQKYENQFFINVTEVRDIPKFPYRGVMIDTARHYIPEHLIISVLTAMMYNKFNNLHWHIVDDQSFPFVSKKLPELSKEGAYNKNSVYTPEAVQRIIEAARVRGIRVILEFDSPGHVAAFGKSHPELLTPCFDDHMKALVSFLSKYVTIDRALSENFDPSNEQVYTLMEKLLEEAVAVSPDKYLHLGFDEVFTPCWMTSPRIRAFMQDYNYTTMAQVQGHYMRRIVRLVKGLGVTPIAWQDPLDEGFELDKDVIIQVWKDLPTFPNYAKIVKSGYKVILSSCWYINLIKYGEAWRKFYECDPIRGANITGYEQNVLGGEAAIWSEFVDQTNLIPRLFPFASATAEVLWTARAEKESTDDAMWRLDDFRCSMLRRGVRAQPILNGYCGEWENDLDF